MTRELVRSCRSGDLISQLNGGQLLVVDGDRRSGLIVQKRYHSEFAGPGSAVGGFFDAGVQRIYPIGELSLSAPPSDAYEARQKAFSTRRQWLRFMEQLTTDAAPLARALTLLERFEQFFDCDAIEAIPNETLATLIGVMPSTIALAHRYKKAERQSVSTPVMV
ncbi:MAG: hypothetical protein ACFB9N_14535 [Geitlerinemataceae cyanobacterium]